MTKNNNNTKIEEVKENTEELQQEQQNPAPEQTDAAAEPENKEGTPPVQNEGTKNEQPKTRNFLGYAITIQKAEKPKKEDKPRKKLGVVKTAALIGGGLYALKKGAEIIVTIMEAANGNSAAQGQGNGGGTPTNYIEGSYTEVQEQAAPATAENATE